MVGRVGGSSVVAGLLLALLMADGLAQAQDFPIPTIPEGLPQKTREELTAVRAGLDERVDTHNLKIANFNSRCGNLRVNDPGVAACVREQQGLLAEETTLVADKKRFASRVSAAVTESAPTNAQLAEILRSIRNIKVPPPILAEDASIGIGQLAPGDVTSKRVLLALEAGVAIAQVAGHIAETAMPAVKLIMLTGKSFIAAEDAADVYLVKQNDVYEHSLKYLKDDKQRAQFTAIVRAIKARTPLSENASIDMIRTAQAILDPKLGNSGTRIAWSAMLSPDAAHAAMTAACIEVAGEITGQTAGIAFQRIRAVQQPAFREAEDLLARSVVANRIVTDPVAKAGWMAAVDQANKTIASTYHAIEPAKEALTEGVSIYTKWALEEHVAGKTKP